MYNLVENASTIFDTILYTVSSMEKVGMQSEDIATYVDEVLKAKNNLGIVNLSEDTINECNCREEWLRSEVEDTWRDHYYIDMWDNCCVDDSYEGFSDCEYNPVADYDEWSIKGHYNLEELGFYDNEDV